jgi:hypothetical protein
MTTEDDEQPAEQLPRYPGWKVSREGRNYVAARDERVSSYQDNWGAVDEVDAGSVEELALLVAAQTRLAVALAEAEKLDTADRAARRHRYLDGARHALRDTPRPTIAY